MNVWSTGNIPNELKKKKKTFLGKETEGIEWEGKENGGQRSGRKMGRSVVVCDYYCRPATVKVFVLNNKKEALGG